MPLFAQWSVAGAFVVPDESFQPLYDKPSLVVERSAAGLFRLIFPGFARFVVDCEHCRIRVCSERELGEETISHFLFDQVFPRIIAQDENLVLHAAAVGSRSGAVLFIGPTGAGKSTLAASLHLIGYPLIGDDAIIVRRNGDCPVAEAVYRSLRLNPDAIAALGATWSHRAMAEYTAKRRIEQSELGSAIPPQPIAAIVCLSEGEGSPLMRVSNLEACMTLAEHSFWLDPSDVTQTCKRLTAACDAVAATPVYSLAFKRDFAVLAAIHQQLAPLLGPVSR